MGGETEAGIPQEALSFDAAQAKTDFEADLNKDQANEQPEEPVKKQEVKETQPQDVEDQYLYHGTNASFEDELRPGASDHKAGGRAVYLTPSLELAHDYAYNGGGYHNKNKSEEHFGIYRFMIKRGTRILNLDEPLPLDELEELILKHFASPSLANEEVIRTRRYYEGGNPQTAEKELAGFLDLNNDADRQLLMQMGYRGVRVIEIGMDGKVRLEVGVWDPSVLVSAIAGKIEPRTDGRLTQEASDYLKGIEKVKRVFGRSYDDKDFAKDLVILKRMASESGINLTGEESGREIMEILKTRANSDKRKVD